MAHRRYRRHNHARNPARAEALADISLSQAGREQHLRQVIAQEAARIMCEEGITDFSMAKRKAGERFDTHHQGHLPSNLEVERALAEYQRLFRAGQHPGQLRRRREIALQAMDLLRVYEPRLVGGVLSGTAGENAVVQLHLFASTPEEVALTLQENHIPYDLEEHTLRMGSNLTCAYPVYAFVADEVVLELTVFPLDGIRQAPLSPVDARPMKRADRKAVSELLAAEVLVDSGRDIQAL